MMNDLFSIMEQMDGLFDYASCVVGYYQAPNFPPLNVTVSKDNVATLELALAGYKKDQLKVTTENDWIIVRAEVEEKQDDGSKPIRHSFSSRSFIRRYSVGTRFDLSTLKAKMEDGILTITVNKKKEFEPKEITVE